MKLFILKRDGQEVCRERDNDGKLMKYIHNMHSCSYEWALKYEGYKVEKHEIRNIGSLYVDPQGETRAINLDFAGEPSTFVPTYLEIQEHLFDLHEKIVAVRELLARLAKPEGIAE